jgi:D-lactate dehydrogenase
MWGMRPVPVFDAKSYFQEAFAPVALAAGVDLRFVNHRLDATTVDSVGGADCVCLGSHDDASAEVIALLAASGVGMIALRTDGYNNVDLEAARQQALRVVHVPTYSPHSVAEHAVALLLAVNRKIPLANNRVRSQNFTLDRLVGFDLHGKTAGIVGAGRIGCVVAQILSGFGMHVLLNNPNPDTEFADRLGASYVDLDELAGNSDVISLHAPLRPETHHLIDDAFLSRCRPGVVLINASRGGLVDTGALIRGLESGRVGGAGLDVYEGEAGLFFDDHSGEVLTDRVLATLLTFPNVLVTSHQGFLTTDALHDMAASTIGNICRYYDDQPALDGTLLTG